MYVVKQFVIQYHIIRKQFLFTQFYIFELFYGVKHLEFPPLRTNN